MRVSTRRGGASVPLTDAPPGFRASVRPSSTPSAHTRLPNLKTSNRESLRRVRADDSARRYIDSNRESLRLENGLTYRKQTTRHHSNREVGASFSTANATATAGPKTGRDLNPRPAPTTITGGKIEIGYPQKCCD